MGGGVNHLLAQGTWPDDYCTPAANCMLLCNPELVIPPSCIVAASINDYDCLSWEQMKFATTPPTTCYNFPGWRNIYGSPDFSDVNDTPTDDTQIRMWATDNEVDEPAECCQRGEGIMAEVDLQSGTPYIMSYLRRILLYCDPGGGDFVGDGSEFLMPPGECVGTYAGYSGPFTNELDNMYIKLTNWDEITWNTDHYLQPDPANFENVLHETSITITNWQKVFQCFTPEKTWNTLYIYPQQDDCHELIFAYIDQVHLIEDDFMDINTEINASCEQAENGIAIGWHCDLMTDLQFTWEYSTNYGFTWLPMSETQPEITVYPVQPTWYRLIRSLANNPNYAVFEHETSSNCIDDFVIIKINAPADCCPEPPEPPLEITEILSQEDFQCCLHETAFRIDQNSSGLSLVYDNMAYTVTVSGTWTDASNELKTVFGGTAVPFLVNTDIIIPRGIHIVMGFTGSSGTGLNINFGPRGRIIVEQGAVLTFNKGVELKPVCSMWQGIRVLGPGKTVLRAIMPDALPNYGKLEGYICDDLKLQSALIGIAGMFVPMIDIANIADELQTHPYLLCDDPFDTNCPTLTPLLLKPSTNSASAVNTAGGVIQLDEGYIFECFQGVNLSWYVNTNTPIPSAVTYINTVKFWGAPLVLYPFNVLSGTTFFDSEAGIYGEDYHRLVLNGNNFTTSKFGARGFEISSWVFNNNDFSDCAVGMSSAGTFTFTLLSTFLNSNTFTNCVFAAQTLGNRLVTSQNTITGFGYSSPSYGIASVQSRFNIYNDDISHVTAGLVIMNSDHETNIAHENIFTDNFLGAWMIGDNDGTYIYCNQFYEQYVAIYLIDDSTTPVAGELDDQGECYFLPPLVDEPADNLFINSTLVDIRSVINDNFDYVHRPISPLTPSVSNAAGGVVTLVPCWSAGETVDCETWQEIPKEEIAEMTDEKQADRLLVQKFWHYMAETSDTAEAMSLLESVNTQTAKRMKIALSMQQGQYSKADSICNTLPQTGLDNQYFRELLSLQIALAQTNRSYTQFSPEEDALLSQIAQSQTTSAMSAKVLRYLAYGEDILVELPPLPEDLTEGMPIQFKTREANSSLISIAPNPAATQLQIQYRLPDKTLADLEIYNTTGKRVYRQAVSQTGNLQLSIEDWTNGIYFYRLVQNGHLLSTGKILVSK
ncbi:MAG: T9SS type A sorting domain-containing protein [Sphingobacteriales bacterium]|nr:MAG: T9SS type A sorting domain-containing protein [Sphingobacteriales bacterium]